MEALDAKLADPACCEAKALDPQANAGRNWQVRLRATDSKIFDVRLTVSFDACRWSVVEDRNIRRYP